MKTTFKTIESIEEYCKGTGLDICIMAPNFISLGKLDFRCIHNWNVKHVIKHTIKDKKKLIDLFERYAISNKAIKKL